ncbi:MAG TPA: cytochrome C oxidase subunit IV family protein [Tepidisphaeraceae bacterium]|nr:cytochrome C oxidase subunit IV family protein [Tepidisphaeraceae bacterium]
MAINSAADFEPRDEHGPVHHEPEKLVVYVAVYVALMVLLVLTVVAAMPQFDLDHRLFSGANIVVAMTIATVKAVLVILIFMHVRHGSALTWVFSSAAFVWLAILVIGTMNDYATRGLSDPGRRQVDPNLPALRQAYSGPVFEHGEGRVTEDGLIGTAPARAATDKELLNSPLQHGTSGGH